jgi:hypothetical protein
MEAFGSHHACSHAQSLKNASWTKLIPNTRSSIQLFFPELFFDSVESGTNPSNRPTTGHHTLPR